MKFLYIACLLAASCLVAAATDPQEPIQEQDYTPPIRVACVGDSITVGMGTSNSLFFSYPSQLGRMLGEKWNVQNFGVSGRTLLNAGDLPYQKEQAFQDALHFNPNVVIIMLGTNDSKPQNWKFKDQFAADYKDLVDKFQNLASHPRIFLCLPVPVPGVGNYGINEPVMREEVPLIQNLAQTENLGVIDMHAALSGYDNDFPDRVHPNDAGANLMAKAAYKTLTGNDFTGPLSPAMISNWEGYKRLDFIVDGRSCILVVPKEPAQNNPWIWRTEFFGAFAQADIALLGKGYFVAYMDMQNMYGAPVAMGYMDKFYDYLESTYQLAPKTVLEGFSRGGLYAFNWAALHPERVACMYVDAPVCDFKSWPAGKGHGQGSPDDWTRLKQVYGFSSDDQALAYTLNPIDNLKPLADAGIPIIAVCGDADKTVPYDENIQIVEKRYLELGGQIKVIVKHGGDHHPHSLPDPTPIVSYILDHT
jgi:lysophospholipase L1-like esterase